MNNLRKILAFLLPFFVGGGILVLQQFVWYGYLESVIYWRLGITPAAPSSALWQQVALVAVVFVFYLIIKKLHLVVNFVIGLVLVIGYLVATVFVNNNQQFLLDVVSIPLAILALLIGEYCLRFLRKITQNRQIKYAFLHSVNEKILEQILKDPKKIKLEGRNKMLTAMFADITDFSAISANLSADELSKFLNEYLTRATAAIFKRDGTLDEYFGDEIKAFWGAPLENKIHAYRACQAALDLIKAVKQFDKDLADDMPKINIGIGINTGNMLVGNLGSTQRFDYSVFGENVTFAAQLKALTKKYHVEIILSESTVEHLQDVDKYDEFSLRLLDTVRLKGQPQPQKIYQLLTKNFPTLVNEYQLAFRLYKDGDFNKASKAFDSIYTNYNDATSKMMVERCMLLLTKPELSKHWDGIWNT